MIKHDEIMLTNDKDNKTIDKVKVHNEANKKYYEKHKEKITEKEVCDLCGGEYQRCSRSKHEKSKKHITAKEIKELKEKLNNI